MAFNFHYHFNNILDHHGNTFLMCLWGYFPEIEIENENGNTQPNTLIFTIPWARVPGWTNIEKERASGTPVFTFLDLLIVETVWAAASHYCHHAFHTMMNCVLKLLTIILTLSKWKIYSKWTKDINISPETLTARAVVLNLPNAVILLIQFLRLYWPPTIKLLNSTS